ncbi:XRE family transcriptional regulator, partial [Ruminococcus sp. AF43-11]
RELYTQAILAEKLDISESYVSQVECGKVKIFIISFESNC